MSIQEIPHEVLNEIFSYLGFNERFNSIPKVSKEFFYVANNENYIKEEIRKFFSKQVMQQYFNIIEESLEVENKEEEMINYLGKGITKEQVNKFNILKFIAKSIKEANIFDENGNLFKNQPCSDYLSTFMKYIKENKKIIYDKKNDAVEDADECMCSTKAFPINTKLPIFYLEFKVDSNCVSVGLIPANYDRTEQPGWKSSIGYHSDDGGLFINSRSNKKTMEEFKKGDVVGIGYIQKSRKIFFTVNGNPQKYTVRIDEDVKMNEFYLAIGMWDNGSATINLGKNQDFLYDISKYKIHFPSKTIKLESQLFLHSVEYYKEITSSDSDEEGEDESDEEEGEDESDDEEGEDESDDEEGEDESDDEEGEEENI